MTEMTPGRIAPDISHRPADHPRVAFGRVGVLLLNLGTPDATSYWPMRRYLKQFLSDPRVIEEPKWKWWPILNLIILTVRPSKKGKDYETIWNKERDEGPLKTITRSQAEKLAARLGGDGRIVVDWAMRYANPSTESRIKWLQEQGCDRILLLPLYPQYAAATSATACDEAFRALDFVPGLLFGLFGAGRVVQGVGRHQVSGDGLDDGRLFIIHPGADEGRQAAAHAVYFILFDLSLHGAHQDPYRFVDDLLPFIFIQGQYQADDGR